MSIRPVLFHEDGSIDVVFDELGHSGTIPADQVRWLQGMDGTDNHNYIVLDCPDGCGSTSTWPVGGGADALMGQSMFVHKELQAQQTRSVPDAVEQVKARVVAMDGEERWALDDAAMQALAAGQTPERKGP